MQKIGMTGSQLADYRLLHPPKPCSPTIGQPYFKNCWIVGPLKVMPQCSNGGYGRLAANVFLTLMV